MGLMKTTWISAVLLVGCGDGSKDASSSTTDTASPTIILPPAPFLASVSTGRVQGHIDDQTVRAHRSAELLNAAMGILISDENVRFRLEGTTGTRSGECWSYLSPPRSEFTIDYSGCEDLGITGGVFVKDHPAGPFLLQFQDFTVDGRTMSGTLGLEVNEGGSTWHVYDTDTNNPGTSNPVPIGVTIDGYLTGMSVEGSGLLRTTPDLRWSHWSSLGFTDAYDNLWGVTLGAESADDIDPSGMPDVETRLAVPSWLECRCPLSGVLTHDVVFTLDTIEVDIDDLQDGDDGYDDPTLSFPISTSLATQAGVQATSCGEFEIDFPVEEDMTLVLEQQQLISLLTIQCDTLAIPDRGHCVNLVNAAQAMPDGISVSVGAAKLSNQGADALEEIIADGFCTFE